MHDTTACSLCGEPTAYFWHDSRREYRACPNCGLLQVPATYHLCDADEKAQYDWHENDIGDAGYRRFLSRLLDPLLKQLPAHAEGMDFGCGPGPALAAMLQEHGFATSLYDKFYHTDPAPLRHKHDFITATEVVEHLAQPGRVLDALWEQLRPGGLLGIMTRRFTDPEAFKRWHYKNDPTHICFFQRRTFEYLAQRWHAQLDFPGQDVVIMQKPDRWSY